MLQATPIRCLMIACLLAFATSSMWAQTGSKSSKSATRGTTTQKTTAKKFRGRLPSNYGKIGLAPKQRDEIYQIQKTYHTEIEELVQRLEALKAKQTAEIYEVLTTTQKTALQALKDKRKSKSSKKTATTTKKTAANK